MGAASAKAPNQSQGWKNEKGMSDPAFHLKQTVCRIDFAHPRTLYPSGGSLTSLSAGRVNMPQPDADGNAQRSARRTLSPPSEIAISPNVALVGFDVPKRRQGGKTIQVVVGAHSANRFSNSATCSRKPGAAETFCAFIRASASNSFHAAASVCCRTSSMAIPTRSLQSAACSGQRKEAAGSLRRHREQVPTKPFDGQQAIVFGDAFGAA